jgi:hypothetical protein
MKCDAQEYPSNKIPSEDSSQHPHLPPEISLTSDAQNPQPVIKILSHMYNTSEETAVFFLLKKNQHYRQILEDFSTFLDKVITVIFQNYSLLSQDNFQEQFKTTLFNILMNLLTFKTLNDKSKPAKHIKHLPQKEELEKIAEQEKNTLDKTLSLTSFQLLQILDENFQLPPLKDIQLELQIALKSLEIDLLGFKQILFEPTQKNMSAIKRIISIMQYHPNLFVFTTFHCANLIIAIIENKKSRAIFNLEDLHLLLLLEQRILKNYQPWIHKKFTDHQSLTDENIQKLVVFYYKTGQMALAQAYCSLYIEHLINDITQTQMNFDKKKQIETYMRDLLIRILIKQNKLPFAKQVSDEHRSVTTPYYCSIWREKNLDSLGDFCYQENPLEAIQYYRQAHTMSVQIRQLVNKQILQSPETISGHLQPNQFERQKLRDLKRIKKIKEIYQSNGIQALCEKIRQWTGAHEILDICSKHAGRCILLLILKNEQDAEHFLYVFSQSNIKCVTRQDGKKQHQLYLCLNETIDPCALLVTIYQTIQNIKQKKRKQSRQANHQPPTELEYASLPVPVQNKEEEKKEEDVTSSLPQPSIPYRQPLKLKKKPKQNKKQKGKSTTTKCPEILCLKISDDANPQQTTTVKYVPNDPKHSSMFPFITSNPCCTYFGYIPSAKLDQIARHGSPALADEVMRTLQKGTKAGSHGTGIKWAGKETYRCTSYFFKIKPQTLPGAAKPPQFRLFGREVHTDDPTFKRHVIQFDKPVWKHT